MKEVIKKAQEGGYTKQGDSLEFERYAVLDPLFWQSLGKAMGWDERPQWYFYRVNGDETEVFWTTVQFHKHRFIDHLADGKNPESFFEELLQTKLQD